MRFLMILQHKINLRKCMICQIYSDFHPRNEGSSCLKGALACVNTNIYKKCLSNIFKLFFEKKVIKNPSLIPLRVGGRGWWTPTLIFSEVGYISAPVLVFINPFSANPPKWSNKLEQFVGNLAGNCLSVFDRFVEFAIKGLLNLFYFVLICFDIFQYFAATAPIELKWNIEQKQIKVFCRSKHYIKNFFLPLENVLENFMKKTILLKKSYTNFARRICYHQFARYCQ